MDSRFEWPWCPEYNEGRAKTERQRRATVGRGAQLMAPCDVQIMTKQELQFLLQRYNLKPRREQGQNFLLDDAVIDSIVQASELKSTDVILEIGPGFGILTSKLAQYAKKVIAVEQDRNIFPAVSKLAKQYPNIIPYNEDVRKFFREKSGLQERNYKLIANLPYSIASWVLREFLEHSPRPSLMVIMVQKEVAQRVVAEPGNMSILSNAVQCFADARIVRIVPHTCFYPAPKIDSAILKIRLKEQPVSPAPAELMRLIKIGFAAKRKQLHKNLQVGLPISSEKAKILLETVGVSIQARPQELSTEQWEQLRKICSN